MRINIELNTDDTDDLIALAALIASLAGSRGVIVADTDKAQPVGRPAPPPPSSQVASSMSDALLVAEANRAAGAGNDADDEDGTSADPAALDAMGVPWDERIHSSSKKQTQKGEWARKRNTPDVLFGQVLAELQERHAGNSRTGTVGNGPASNAGRTAPPPPATASDPAPLAPASAEAENVRTAAPPPPAAGATGGGRFADFPSFVQAVNALREPSIPYAELNNYAQTVGVVGGFKDMKDNPSLWETFYGLAGGQ